MEFNWPVVALILGLVAILAFRKQLADLVGRTEKIKDWVVAPKPSNPVPQAIEKQVKQLDAFTASFHPTHLKLQEDAIEAWLKADGVTIETANERQMLRYLAAVQLSSTCERLASQIYVSQLNGLRWVNTQPAGAAIDQFRPFYDVGAKQSPLIYANFSFEQWFAFLKVQTLVVRSETPSATSVLGQDMWRITYLGKDFLKYFVDQGKPEPIVG
jgi:hypothetical protein